MATPTTAPASLTPANGGTAPLVRSERLLRQLQTVTEVGMAISRNLAINTLLQTVADITKERFDLYHTHVYLLDQNNNSLNLEAGAGEPGRIMRERGHHIPFDRERSLVARAARTREGVISNDVTQEPDFLSNPLLPNTMSEMAVPIVISDKVLGVLDVQASEVNRFDQDDVRVFTTLASQIAVALDNARQFEQVRLYADSFNNMSTGFYLYKLEKPGDPLSLRMVATNQAAADLTGAPMESVIGRTIGEAFPNLVETPIPQIYHDIAQNGGNWQTENVAYSDDRIAGAFAVKAFALPEMTVGVTFENITERKKDEAVIAMAQKRAEILARINAALSQSADEQSILSAYTGLADEQMQLASLSYIKTNADGSPYEMNVVALAGAGGSLIPLDILPIRTLTPEQYPLIRLLLDNPNQTLFIEDSEDDPRIDDELQQYNRALNIRSSALTPLYSAATGWVGVIILTWAAPHKFSAFERELFDAVQPTVLSVVNTRLQYLQAEAARQQLAVQEARTARIAQVTTALTTASDEDSILATISRLAAGTGMTLATLSYLDYDAQGKPALFTVKAITDGNGNPLPLSILPANPIKPEEYPLIGLVYQTPNAVTFIEDALNDARVDPMVQAYLQAVNVRAMMIIPLHTATGVDGVVALAWDQPRAFSDEDQIVYARVLPSLIAVVGNRRQYLATLAAEMQAEDTSRRLQQVAEISTTLMNIFDLDEMLITASELIKARFNRYHAHVYLLDEHDRLMLAAGAGEAGRLMKARQHMIPLNREHSLVARAARTRQGVFSNNVSHEPDFLPNPLLPETQSELSIPLIVGDRVIGVLDIQSKVAGAFSDNDVFIKTVLASQLAASIETLRQFAETERAQAVIARRAVELETVAEIARTVTTVMERDEMLQLAADLIKTQFNRYHAHIYLYDTITERLVLAAGAGEVGREMKARQHSISLSQPHSLVARAARTQQGVIANDVYAEADFLPNPSLPDTRSEMAIPMVVGNTLIGVLDLQDTMVDGFDSHDVSIKSALASQIAVAVDNLNKIDESLRVERETAERLREVDRLKSQFLANMSHELRTPLNSIIGYSEILLDGDDGELNEEAHEDVETIHQSGQHLLELINDILDVAKIEAGEMRLERRSVDLVKIASEVLHTAEVLVKDKPITLDLLPSGDLLPVYADPIRVRQIMMNLVSNAIKFTEHGSVTIGLGLESPEMAYIDVTDTGMGISEDDLHVIFEQFRQVDGSSTRRAGGTGLGLTITRYLVNMHGGDIRVSSKVGVGSNFRFSLPIAETTPA